MRTIRRTFSSLSTSTILLGSTGENGVTSLAIDVSDEMLAYPGSYFELLFKRPNETDYYPVVCLNQEDAIVYTLTESDLSIDGFGQIELVMYGANDEILKSRVGKTKILKSMSHDNSYSGPIKQWIDLVTVLGNQISALSATVDAHTSEIDTLSDEIDAIPTHEHANKRVLDRFDGVSNRLSYNGLQIPLVPNDNVVLLPLKAYHGLFVRDEEISGSSIVDVPFYAYHNFDLVDTSGDDPYNPDRIWWHLDYDAETGRPVLLLCAVYHGVEYEFSPVSGWLSGGVAVDAPSFDSFTPTVYRFGGSDYTEIEALPAEAASLLRSLSQCINESAEAMGTIDALPDATEIFTGTLKPNRSYFFTATRDFTLSLPDVCWDAKQPVIRLNTYCTQDVAVTLPQEKLLDDETLPRLTAGYHELVFTYVPLQNKWSVACADSVPEADAASDTLVPLTLGTEYDLQIRSDWTDVPIYLVAEPSYRIGLQTGESDPTEAIRVFEATDNATWVPCPIIKVKRGDDIRTYYPRTFTDISSEISAGWYDENMTATTAPSLDNMTFGALDVCGTKYTDLSDLPSKAQLALETLSRIINVSTTAMGTLGIVEDGVQRYQGVIEPNRKYAFAKGVGDATVDLPTVPWSVHDAQFVMYLTCSNDVDFSFTAGTYFSNGIAPNTGTGKHKLIGCWLKDAEAWAVGGIDYAGVS